jgi:Flp pilus assembly protein TadG
MTKNAKDVSAPGSNRGPLNRTLAEFNSSSGQTLVEFALLLLFLLSIAIGAVDLGRLAYMTVGVTNAAHAGAEYGCQNVTTAANVSGMETQATNDATDLVGSNNGNLSATANSFCQCADGSSPNSSCTNPPACAGTHLLQYVSVSTTATYNPWFPYPGIPKGLTLHGNAIMQVGQ